MWLMRELSTQSSSASVSGTASVANDPGYMSLPYVRLIELTASQKQIESRPSNRGRVIRRGRYHHLHHPLLPSQAPKTSGAVLYGKSI